VSLDPSRDAHIDLTTKGFPTVDRALPLAEVAAQGWTLADLLPPVLVLRETAVAHNIARMADYCRAEGVELAPHGKTAMAPQIWRRQLDAGAWGISAATVAQARVMAAAGVPRIFIANELTDPVGIGWLAVRLREPGPEIACAVDSAPGVELLAANLRGAPRPLPVLVELGHPGGRTGCRSVDDAVSLAGLVRSTPELALAGATGFEGTICEDRSPACLDEIRRFLDELGALGRRLRQEQLVETEELWLSAGGSVFFDVVVERLRTVADRVILRSGRYATHDAGLERSSPFAGEDPGRRFRTAIEVWGAVVSRPEPELAILNLGRRDVPFDQALPAPFTLRRSTGESLDVAGRISVERLNDQHAMCLVDLDEVLQPGDLVGCSVSHACTAFDKWRVIPVLDDDDRVVDAVATYF
jgi:D-serine deaminase-like pyridoxal phosphate-dependent protein